MCRGRMMKFAPKSIRIFSHELQHLKSVFKWQHSFVPDAVPRHKWSWAHIHAGGSLSWTLAPQLILHFLFSQRASEFLRQAQFSRRTNKLEPRVESENGSSYTSFTGSGKSEKLLGVKKNVRRFPIGRIDEGHLIPLLVTDPTEQVNNSTVPLRGHKYQHGMTNYLLEHILHVCFSHSTSSRWTLQMWRTGEGRFRMTPACPSPAPSVVCPLERICCISERNPVQIAV